MAYLLQGNGEGTSLYYNEYENQLIIAANGISSITTKKCELLKFINDIMDFFDRFYNVKALKDEEEIFFLKICHFLLNGLQINNPYKYLLQDEQDKLDEFINDFYKKKECGKHLRKCLNNMKNIYGNSLAQQICKTGYIFNKAKHSYDVILRQKNKNNSNLNLIFENNMKCFKVLQDCNELNLVSLLLKKLSEDPKTILKNEMLINLENQNKIKTASQLKIRVHGEMKIMDKLLSSSSLDLKRKTSIYIASSKLFCYDCHLMKKAFNNVFGNILEISSNEGEETENM